jgi:hypothetical protein
MKLKIASTVKKLTVFDTLRLLGGLCFVVLFVGAAAALIVLVLLGFGLIFVLATRNASDLANLMDLFDLKTLAITESWLAVTTLILCCLSANLSRAETSQQATSPATTTAATASRDPQLLSVPRGTM